MKKQLLLTRMLLLVALLVGSVSAWGQAAKDDVLWSEPFKGSASTSTTFSETEDWGDFLDPTTLVASDASSLSYTTSKAMASGVTTAANMSGTHVWLNKSVDAYIQVAGIKLYNATKVKVSWAQSPNGSSTTVYYQFDGTGDFTALSTCSGPNENFESNELTVSNHTTIALRFFHPSSNSKNTRIDNLKLTATAVETASVTSLSINTAPTKTRYEVGESLDMTGFALNADGNTVTSGYTMKMGDDAILNGATLNSAGKKTLVVSYGGKTVNQPISVGSVTSIAVTTPPTKTTYDTGDSFAPAGMVVTASLSTGEAESPDTWTKEVTGYTIDPEDNLVPANTYVTITYATKTATQDITVNPYIQPLSVNITFGNALYGTSYTGAGAAGNGPFEGTVDNVTVTVAQGSGSNLYVTNTETRIYGGVTNGTITLAAPTGFAMKKIVFNNGTAPSKWDIAASPGTLSSATWTGSASEVVFSASSRSDFTTATVTLAPKVTITAAKYATFSSPYRLNFEGSNVKAYKAISTDGASVTLVEMTVVDANVGVLLHAETADTYYIPSTSAAATSAAGNLLQSTATAAHNIAADEVGRAYVFGKFNDTEVGFFMAAEGKTIDARKSYLLLDTAPANNANFLSFVFGDEEQGETDGIKAVSTKVENGVRYNLAGQKVGADYKGIVIVNGKKVIIK